MKTAIRHTVAGMALAALAVLPTGCRKDLCYDHDEHNYAVKVDAVASWEREWERSHAVDWESEWAGRGWDGWIAYDALRPDAADGIRCVVYKSDGIHSSNNLPPEGGRLPLSEEGAHALLFYNNDTEYIVFDNLTASAAATATTRTRTRGGFGGLHADERTINPPDMLYGAYIDEYVASKDTEVKRLPVAMRPLTYTYAIRYEFDAGLEYVALARGALAGMAESVYLQDGHTGSETATILFDDDACRLTDFGVEARLQSFGVPDYPGDHYAKATNRYTLNLEVRLSNGAYKTFEFDVTDQVAAQPRGGVIVVSGIVVSGEEAGGGSGFDVDVDGWGAYEDIEMPLN